MRVRHAVVLCGLIGLVGQGCQCNPHPGANNNPDAGDTEGTTILTEHRFETPSDAGRGAIAIASDCRQFGAGSCASNICLHTSPDPEAGWVCSQKCDCAEQCPAKWACVQIHPLESARYCLPAAE